MFDQLMNLCVWSKVKNDDTHSRQTNNPQPVKLSCKQSPEPITQSLEPRAQKPDPRAEPRAQSSSPSNMLAYQWVGGMSRKALK